MQISRSSRAFQDVTPGILAGGGATRLGGIDKAWLERDGMPQVLRLRNAFDGCAAPILVSANRDLSRYAPCGLHAVPDRFPDMGPLAGIDGLLAACKTEWLLSVPVDIVSLPHDLIERMVAGAQGAFAQDDDGPQPLVALWRVATTRPAIEKALASGVLAVHQLQAQLDMRSTRFHDFRFGNLNTPDDLAAAGMIRETSRAPLRGTHG